MRRILLAWALGGVLLCTGCSVAPVAPVRPSAPTPSAVAKPAPMLRLRKTDFSSLSGWGRTDPAGGLSAFRRSCGEILNRSPAATMGLYGGTAGDWRAVCRQAQTWNGSARDFFESGFVALRVTAEDGGRGLFTGYYEPEIRARREATATFNTPVYGRPTDMVEVDLGTFRPNLKGDRLAGRVVGGKLVPLPKRAEIEAKGLSAPVLFYTDDPVDLFFLQIQGSGRARFDDDHMVRVTYDGQNGWPYSAIGKVLSARGAVREVSLATITAWLRANPDQAQSVMDTNESYVFFKLAALGDPTAGPKGAEGVALTPLASVAVDTKYHPLGVPFFVSTTTADGRPLDAVLVAQDRGGAIRGVVRGDIFFGFGPDVRDIAGGMKGAGSMVALLPKAIAERLADDTVLEP